MTEWSVLEVIITVVAFIATVIGLIIPVVKVIQKNTDAINSLTTELRELAVNNKQDHNEFFADINHLKQDVAVLKEKTK